MGIALQYDAGQTPLDENETEGLLLKTISTQGELNEAEMHNVGEGLSWTMSRQFETHDILSEKFCNELHRRMYNQVWRWAGSFRRTNKNIGVDKLQIALSLRKLNDDCLYWIENKVFPEDEIAIQYKHRLVSIHCFPNGNGRHSRLMADVIVSQVFGRPEFSWGESIGSGKERRAAYLNALRVADRGDIKGLVEFARS